MAINHYIKTEGGATRQVYPYNAQDLGIEVKPENGFQYREKLNTDIVLINTKESRDYSFILDIEQGNNTSIGKYDILSYIIEDTVEGKTYNFEFQVINAIIDKRQGNVSIKPELVDAYTPFYKNKKEKVNILTTSPKHTVKYKGKSYLEWAGGTAVFVGTPSENPPSGNGWEYFGTYKFLYNTAGTLIIGDYRTYGREVVYVESGETPNGSGWIADGSSEEFDRYVRKFLTYGNYDAATYPSLTSTANELLLANTADNSIWKKIHTDVIVDNPQNVYLRRTYQDFDYTQNNTNTAWMYLRDVLTVLVNNMNPDFSGSVVSTFLFNDNYEDGTSAGTTNYATGRANDLNDIYLIENSDCKKPNASDKATKELLDWETFWQDELSRYWGKVFWFIDTNGNFRIEHEIYLTFEVGIDLADAGIKNYETLTNIEYDANEILNREILKHEEQSSNDWDETYVITDVPLVDGSGENAVEYTVKVINTDIDNLTSFPDGVSNTGMIMCITELDGSDRIVKQDTGLASLKSVQNAGLSAVNAEVLYGEHQRAIPTFEVKNISGYSVNNSADSIKPIKIEQVSFIWNKAINYYKSIKTLEGNGRIKELTKLFSTKDVNVKLAHV